MTAQARSFIVVAAVVLGCGVGVGAKPPQESPQELLRKATERLVDSKHAGPITLQYALHFPDGRAGSYVWRQRDQDNYREEIQVGSFAGSRGVVAGKGWQSPADDLLEVRWLVSTLLGIKAQLAPRNSSALKVRSRRIRGQDFLEIWSEPPRGRRGWVVMMSWPQLDLSLSEIGFVRCIYLDWKELPDLGTFPGACRIYLQDQLALEMTLERGTNKPIEDAELSPAPGALPWAQCPGAEDPKSVSRTPPAFPEAARLDRAQGFVVLSGIIEADGSVAKLQVVRALTASEKSRALLVDAAIAAVSKWHYEPPLCKGTLTRRELQITVAFTLE